MGICSDLYNGEFKSCQFESTLTVVRVSESRYRGAELEITFGNVFLQL